ncbi:DUF1203 domain-containing protein [Rhizobium sp. CSW-27]|uniref:DUF1203 domain-containing protein n=1 Tax=Rhizobium sp. CSW-27 TaxID=2839985 RepID=UPI001C037CEA|nr:DUF1203 domain-containing protein [Rhizobium sp. CSW-27]MBT9370387.1 DUF1203 domain-containing protein [Rhizobium sp. CSW-27]
MPAIRFTAMPAEAATALWNGATDAYDHPPERTISSGEGTPCRHCLGFIAAGESMLVLAYRPFPQRQPYAETGPIFLHGGPCPRYEAVETLPPMLASPDYILRGYDENDRIVYGTGAVTPTEQIAARAATLLVRPEIAYVHVRSARNNCYQCRIDRA